MSACCASCKASFCFSISASAFSARAFAVVASEVARSRCSCRLRLALLLALTAFETSVSAFLVRRETSRSSSVTLVVAANRVSAASVLFDSSFSRSAANSFSAFSSFARLSEILPSNSRRRVAESSSVISRRTLAGSSRSCALSRTISS